MNYIVILSTGRGKNQERTHVHIVDATSRVDARNAFDVLFGERAMRDDVDVVATIPDDPEERVAYEDAYEDAHTRPLGTCSRVIVNARTGEIIDMGDDDPLAFVVALLDVDTIPVDVPSLPIDPSMN